MDYYKIWSLFNKQELSERAMAKAVGMSPSGFKEMMSRKTMSVEKLEKIALYFELPVSYFFDAALPANYDPKQYKAPARELPQVNDKDEPWSCPLCKEKDEHIKSLKELVKSKQDKIDYLEGNDTKTGTSG